MTRVEPNPGRITLDCTRPIDSACRPVRFEELFKIGIGPSSSHTVGPMRAAGHFLHDLGDAASRTCRLSASVFGSLAWTGRGHATDKAIVLGLAGEVPDEILPADADRRLREIIATRELRLPSGQSIIFRLDRDVVFDRDRSFPYHPNAMMFEAFDKDDRSLLRQLWFSIGGGFVEREGAKTNHDEDIVPVPFPYSTARELLDHGNHCRLGVDEIVLANETVSRLKGDVLASIDRIAAVMFACIDRGLATEGELPGSLKLKRRAHGLFQQLQAARAKNDRPPAEAMSYISTFAIAVNEENAAGGRVVTAPTNGAAGVFPAVLRYYVDFCPNASQAGIYRLFLAATAIGGIIKRNASISGAEVGCQGEVGSAAAMAAAGLAAALGGSIAQVENAAEIAMEHHLGMTCDPIGGLVQIPCIERNAFGAVKAVTAATLALQGNGIHRVMLDQVVETMRQTGADMSSKYRETSRGGLAVNVPEC